MTASDQAIDRVLNSNRSSSDQKTEALSLMARNAKTRWRQAFENIAYSAQRRKAAANRQLVDSCDGYMKAYSGNLNHHWSGLAALQMCAVAKSLADEETWEDAFDTATEAKEKKDELTRAFDDLQGAVKLAIQRARTNEPLGGNDRAWADISNADWLFLQTPKTPASGAPTPIRCLRRRGSWTPSKASWNSSPSLGSKPILRRQSSRT